MEENYLPIGSVVKVNNVDGLVMIIGYYSLDYTNDIRIYDYIGCSYPEGMLLKNNFLSFDHEEIVSCEYTGYVTEQFKNLNNRLRGEFQEKTISEKENDEKKDDDVVYIDNFSNSNDFLLIEDDEQIDDLDIDKNIENLNEDNLNTSNEEFKMPHYHFDENGIIISE